LLVLGEPEVGKQVRDHRDSRDWAACPLGAAVALRVDRKCGLGVSFDLMTGRLALGREAAASMRAAFLLATVCTLY
jgi:hypothetical protein